MSQVKIEVAVDVRRPSEYPLIDEIQASIDRHGFAEVAAFYFMDYHAKHGINLLQLLEFQAKKAGWEITRRIDTDAITIRQRRPL